MKLGVVIKLDFKQIKGIFDLNLGFWGFGVLGFWGFGYLGICIFWVFWVFLGILGILVRDEGHVRSEL